MRNLFIWLVTLYALGSQTPGALGAVRGVLSWSYLDGNFDVNPYDGQVADNVERLESDSQYTRAAAAEALGYLRAYSAAEALAGALDDESDLVRREAVMALAWCGGRSQVPALLDALEDSNWTVRQGAWVALTNITGMEFSFDAFADRSVQGRQVKKWRDWWQEVPKGRPPVEVVNLLGDRNLSRQLRAVRALGSLGGERASKPIIKVIMPYREANYRKLTDLEKNLVQCGLRSLGRLRDPQSFEVLLSFFDTVGWARYAADALGDFGSRRAIGPLTQAYPSFSRHLNDRQDNPDRCPRDDRFSGDNTQDRMHETPYAIALTLSRLPLDDEHDRAAIRGITSHLVANMPTSWDSGVFYDIEAAQLVTAYLLEEAGMRQKVCDAAFHGAGRLRKKRVKITGDEATTEDILAKLSVRMYGDVPDIATWFPAFCRGNDVPRLIGLLNHEDGWIAINVAKALMFINDSRAIEPAAKLLAESKPEALWGYSGVLEHAEYNDPAPRRREAYIRLLGRLGAKQYDQLLIDIMQDDRNAVEMHRAAALSLDELDTPAAIAALMETESQHPFESVRLVAREAMWRRGLLTKEPAVAAKHSTKNKPNELRDVPNVFKRPDRYVFIKGNNKVRSDFNGQAGVDPWRQAYTITNSGPTFRIGTNLYIIQPDSRDGKVEPLTSFTKGFVADCEVSWDGTKIIFSRRLNSEQRNYSQVKHQKAVLKEPDEPLLGGNDDPWWHVWEINVDGTGLRQLTFGPYHDVMPAYLPDGRVIFSSSRVGMRDEYHGYPSIGLTVMNADGSDIHTIGFNLGGDRDPAVMEDGRVVFSRVDIFYSRLKTEVAIHTVFPDGTRNESLYGPERRPFWVDVHRANAAWTMRGAHGGGHDNRNRVLRLSQPQPLDRDRIVFASSGGLAIAGPGRYQERLVPHDRKWAVTSPYPLGDDKILCAATVKQFKVDDGEKIITAGMPEFARLDKGPGLFRRAVNIDLALYIMDARTGEMELLYNDPDTADIEARPIMARPRPAVLVDNPNVRSRSYTAKLFCNSARISRHDRVAARGKFVRVIEGQPVVSRHETQQNRPTNRWKNHGGTHARVLGTVPLAADGSFFVEVPADRLLHLQVLDSDRRVLGNQVFWMYARPGETRSCVGCHENRDNTLLPNHFAATAKIQPVQCLPTGGEFSYRAKSWLKGYLPDEAEERTRTVRAVNLIGRY